MAFGGRRNEFLFDKTALIDRQYTAVAGKWPEALFRRKGTEIKLPRKTLVIILQNIKKAGN